MPNDVASVVTWQLNSSSQGNKKLRRVQTWDVASDASKEAKNEVGSSVPVAFMRKPGAKTITFEILETKGSKPECDWDYLEEADEVFSLTKQVVGGRRTQYPECQVSKVTYNGDSDGKASYTVEIIALRRKAM